MQFEPDFGGFGAPDIPDLGGVGFDDFQPKEPEKPDYNSVAGVLQSDAWKNARPIDREVSAPTGFRKMVDTLSADKKRTVPFLKSDGSVDEAPMFFPNGSLTIAGKDYLQRANEAFKMAAKMENGGISKNWLTGEDELDPFIHDMLNKPVKETGPLSKVGQYVQSTRTFDEEGNLPGLKWEDYVEWYNAGVKSDGAKIDPKNKELASQFYRRAKEADFDPTTLGDKYGVLINGRLALNPDKYNDIAGVEAFIANHKDLTAADKKLALLEYRSTIEKIGGDLVLRFAAKDAGILGSYFGMPLLDEYIKNAANPEFSFYDYLKANKDRFMKDDSLVNEVVQTFKDALMSTGTGALFWVGKGLGAAGWEGAEKTLAKPAEAHGWLAEQRMQGFDNEGVAFSVGGIDITRRDLTELAGQVGSFVVMGGLGRAAVQGMAKAGVTAPARASAALQKAAAGTAAMAADDVALAATKSLGVKGLDQLKALGLDATAYAAGLQASGMSFGRTHAQVMEQTGDDDEAFREASIQGISDGLSAFIATGVMNRFGMGAEAAFGGASNRASGGLFQRMRARSLTSEGRKAAQEALEKLSGAPKELTRAMSRELVSTTNKRAQALGLRGWGVLGGAVSEGIEETADEVISTAIQAMFQDSKSWSDEFWTNVHDNWQGYVKAGILGALGGMGGNAWESVRHPVHTFGAHDGAVTELKKFHQRMKLGLESLNTDNAVVFEEQTRKFSEFIGDQSMTVKEKARILVEQAESRFLDMTAAVVPEGTVDASKAASAAQSQTGAQDASQPSPDGKEGASVAQVLSKVGIGDQNTQWKKSVTLAEGGISAESGSTRYVQMVIKGDEETGDAPAFVRKIEKGPDGQPIITDLPLSKAKEEIAKLPRGFRDKPKALRNWIDSTLKQQQSKTDVYAQWKEPSAADNGNRGKKPAPGETADGNRPKAEAERNQRPASDGGTESSRRNSAGASSRQVNPEEKKAIDDVAIMEDEELLKAATAPLTGGRNMVKEKARERLESEGRWDDVSGMPKLAPGTVISYPRKEGDKTVEQEATFVGYDTDGKAIVEYDGKKEENVSLRGARVKALPKSKPPTPKQDGTQQENKGQGLQAEGQIESPQLADSAEAPTEDEDTESSLPKGAEAKLKDVAKELGVKAKLVEALPVNEVRTNAKTGEKSDTVFGVPSLGVVIDRAGNVFVTKEAALESRLLKAKIFHATKLRDNALGKPVKAADIAEVKEDMAPTLVDENTLVVNPEILPGGSRAGTADSSGGRWDQVRVGAGIDKKTGDTGTEYFTYTPAPGMELSMAPGDVVLIGGDKTRVLILEDSFNNLNKRSENRPKDFQGKENKKGKKTQGAYRFRLVDLSVGVGGVTADTRGLPERTKRRLDTINNRFWRSTLHTISDSFASSIPKLLDGSITEKEVGALLDGVVAQVAPGLKIKKRKLSDAEGYIHYNKADGMVHVDMGKFREKLALRYGRGSFGNINANNPVVQKLIAMDVAQMVGHIINEEGIHEATARVFNDEYLAGFYDELSQQAGGNDFFLNMMKQIAFSRENDRFGSVEKFEDIDLGILVRETNSENDRQAEIDNELEGETDEDRIADLQMQKVISDSKILELMDLKVELAMELVRAAYQLVHTGTTTERHAAEVSGLFAAMNEDSDPGKKTVAKGFLKTLALLVKRYAQRIRTVLMLRYHQGHLPEGYTDILAKLHTSYTDLGYRGDTEMIQLGAAERSQDIADFTYSRMMDEIGYIGRAHNEALTRLRELPAKLYMDGSKRLEDILEVNPDDMTLRIRESARALMEDSEYKDDVEAIDTALAELNSVEWNGNTSFGKAMLHASLLREVADMRLAALDFNPTGIFTFDTRNVDKPDNARLRIIAEIASGMRSDPDLGNVLMRRMERDLANIEAQIESARSTLFLSLLQETAALDVNTATGRRRLMQIARGVIGINSRGESLYQRFTGGQSDETIRQSLEDLRGQIIESLTIQQAADKIRDTGVPVPLFDSKRTVRGTFKTEQLIGPAKMKVLEGLEAEKQYREHALAFFRQRGDQDEQALRNRAESLERIASLLDESDPREAEVMRFQARLTREQIGVDQNEARRRYNDFKAYIEANNEFNDAIQHVVNTAIGQSYKDPTGFGLSWHSTLPTQPTDPKTGQPLPNNKLPDITPDSPPSEAFLQQVVSRTDTAADKGMDYASRPVEGRFVDNEYIEPSAQQIKEREDYRSIIESNAAFFGREHYRTAMRDFMAGHVGADDDFLAYFSTAGLNLSYVTEEDSGRIRYESWDNIFRKLPGFARIYGLKRELDLIANGKEASLAEGRTPEVVARELVEFATQAKQWLENLERVTDGVVERIGKEATLGMRIARFLNGTFPDAAGIPQNTLSEARNQIRLFTNDLFNVLSTAGGFVGARNNQGPDGIRDLELQPKPNIENLKAAMPALAESLQSYFSPNGLFIDSIRALGSAAHVANKALHEFHDGTAGSGVGWRENVRREIQRTIDNPAYIPEHPDFAQLRDTPIDLSTFNKLSFALRYFEKSTSYFAGPGWAFEYLQKINVAQARGDGGEPSVDREGNVQERSRLGPDNRPAAVFNQGQTANTVAAWTEQSVAPGFGETESFQTPQERDARNRARPANALKSAVTEALMMIGYHSDGDRKSSFGDRSAENAQRFTQQVFAHAIPSVPTGQLASPMNLVRRGVRGAFPALADEEIDGVVEEFLAENPIYETLEAMRSSPSVTERGQVANDGRIDPETFVTDILEFKSRFERSALESAQIKRGGPMALAHNALLAVALRGDWNKGKEKDSANLLEESKAFIANFQQRDAGRLEKLSEADYEAEVQQIRTGQAAVHDKYRKMTIGSIRIGRAAGEGTSGNIPWHTLLTEDQRADYQSELSELQTRWDALQDRKRASDRKARIRELASAGASIDLFVKEWTESNVTDNPSVTEEESFELVKFMQHAFLHGDGTLPVYDVRSAPFASWGYLSDNPLLSHLLESVPATRLVNDEPVPVKTIVIAPDDAYLTRHGKGLLKTGLGLTFIPGTGTLPNIIYAPQGLRSARGEQAGSLIARTLVYHANNNPDALQEVMAMGNKINEVMTNALDLTAFMSSTGIGSALFTKFGKEVSQSPEVAELFEQAKTKQKAQLREALGRHYRQLTAMAKVMNMTKRTVSLQSLDPKMDNWKLHENAALIGELLSNKEFKTFFDHAMMDQVELLDGGLAPQVADSLLSAIKNVGLGSSENGEMERLDVGPQDIADRTITQQAAAAEDQYRLDEDEDEEAGRDDFVEYFESMLEELGWEGAEESSDSETAPENTLPSTIGLVRLLRAIVDEKDDSLSQSQAEALAVSDATRFLFNGLANIFRSSDFGNWVADHAAMDKQIGKTRFRSKEHLLASAKDRRRSAPIFGHEQSLRGGRRVFVGDVANLVYPRVGSHTPMKGMMDPARYNNTAAVLTAKLEGVKSRILNLAGRSVERMQADGLDYAPAMEHAVALDQATIAELDNLLPQVPVEVDGEIVMTGAVTARIAERRRANQSLLESRLETIEAIRMLDERIAELRTVNALPDVGLTPEQFARMDRERVMSSMADWFVGEANAMLAASERPYFEARGITAAVNQDIQAGRLSINFDRINQVIRDQTNELGAFFGTEYYLNNDFLAELQKEAHELNKEIKEFAVTLRERIKPLIKDKKAAAALDSALRFPLLQIDSADDFTNVADFRSRFMKSVSAERITGVLARVLSRDVLGEFGSASVDTGVDVMGARPAFKRPSAKQTKAMRDRRNAVRQELTGWIFENAENGRVRRERVLTALRDGFGLRQEMLDSGRVVPFDFLDAMVDASALSSEDVRRQMSEALDPAAQQAIVQLESRRVQLEKSLAKANAEIASLQGETKNDQFIGSYYHTHSYEQTNQFDEQPDVRQTKVRADLSFRHPDTVAREDDDGVEVVAADAFGNLSPEQKMDWNAVSTGAIEALKEYAKNRVDDVYKRLRGHPDTLKDFDPVKLLERAVRIVDSDNAIMAERMQEARTAAEEAQMRGMTIEATTLITDPSEMDVYQRGKSGRIKRYRLPKSFRERRQHIGRLFNVTDPNGQMVPIVLVSRNAREDLMKYFPAITRRNVEEKLASAIARAGDLGSNVLTENDIDYLAAVKAGDKETAQRILDDVRKAAGYTERGARSSFYIKGVPGLPSSSGNLGAGYYAVLNGTAEDVRPYANSPANGGRPQGSERITGELFINLGDKVIELDHPNQIVKWMESRGLEPSFKAWLDYQETVNSAYRAVGSKRPDSLEQRRAGMLIRETVESKKEYRDALLKNGYREIDIEAMGLNKETIGTEDSGKRFSFLFDQNHATAVVVDWDAANAKGMMIGADRRSGVEVAVAEPTQFKSADLITRDADGNVIPLSKRFNSQSDSIFHAGELGSNYDVQSDGETPSFFMRYANEVRGNAFNAGLELKNRLSAETQAFLEEGKTNREVADRFVTRMRTDVIKRLEDEMRLMDNQNPVVKQRKFDTSGETTQAILRQYSEMLRLLVYAWNNEALTTGTNSGREKLLNLIVAIDNGDFIRNPRKYRVEDVLAKVFSDIEGQAILQEMTAGIIGINSPTSRFFHKYFHHHDARIRRRFLKKRAARETARRLMNLLDRGVDGLSGRAAYEAAKKNSENRIAGAAKELGFSAREHTLGYVIAQLKGLDSRFGYAYGNAFVNWYRAIQAGNYQLGQLDTAQKAKFGDGARRYFQANHLDIVRDTKLAQEVLSIIEQANPDEVINRFESNEDQVYNEEEYRNLANDIIRRLEAASVKGKQPVNSYADTINDVFIDIGNAMHVAQFFVSQDSRGVKIEKKWKDLGAPEFRHSYSSVPVRLGYASDPNADEDKRSKREGAFAEDPADILAFREASFFNGLGKNAGTEQGRTVYRPLVINGLTAPIGMVDDALFRLYVTPSYEVARRMVGRSVEDRHGLQTVVDQDSYMMQNAQDMPEEWRNKHLSDSDSSLSTVASEMETIIRNETQYGVVNTGFAETARWLSSSYIARSLASVEQFWNQSIGPVIGYLAKKAVVGDWQGIRDFLDVYARQFPSAVKSWTEGKKQSGEQSDLFIDDLTKFVRDVDLFVYYRAHEVSDEKSQTIRKQFRGNRGKVVGAAATAAKVYEAWGEKMLGWTIGGPERLLGRAIFLSEIRSELRRRNSPLAEMPVDELIKHADQIDSSVGSYARTKVNDMLGQSDQAKKGWLFQSRDSSPVMSTLWKSITRFSNHTASTASNLNTFVPVIFERKIGSKFSGKQSKYDDATYQEALENVTGTLVQNILFSMLKPKMLVPSLAYLFYMLGGDDDDKAQREAQKLANKLMTVDEDEGVTAGNVTKALLFGRQKELFMQTKSPDAAQASAMAEMLNNALREAAPAIPVIGVGFGYFWGQKLSGNLITEPVSKQLASLATGVDVSAAGRFDRKGINIREYQPGALEALAETSAPAAAVYDIGDAAVRSVRAGQTGEFNLAEIATYLAAEALPPFRELRSYYQKRMQDEIRLRNLD